MTYQPTPKPTREEAIKRNAQNFLIAQIRATGKMLADDIHDAIRVAIILHDAKIPAPVAS